MTQPREKVQSTGVSGDAHDPPDRRWVHLGAPAAFFVSISALLTLDIATDVGRGQSLSHLVVEALAAGLGVLGAAMLWRRWWAERRSAAASLEGALADAGRWRVEADRWRREAREALDSLSRSIDHQFDRWELSPAEREVALLLLKGFSLKEIAALRATAERTARQQSLAVYRKADLAGRAELSAFFLEDLLAPHPDAGRD